MFLGAGEGSAEQSVTGCSIGAERGWVDGGFGSRVGSGVSGMVEEAVSVWDCVWTSFGICPNMKEGPFVALLGLLDIRLGTKLLL